MRKVFLYLVVYLLSALIFYGGSGVNIASFCCGKCQSEGITGIVEGVCCEIHCHDNEVANIVVPDIDSDCDTHDNHCTLSRIEYDWDFSNISNFRCEPCSFELIKICSPLGMSIYSQALNSITYEYSTGPPSLCPSDYLSLLTILLI